jgi:hypothetical protein
MVHAFELLYLGWGVRELSKCLDWIALFFLFPPDGRWATCWFRWTNHVR